MRYVVLQLCSKGYGLWEMWYAGRVMGYVVCATKYIAYTPTEHGGTVAYRPSKNE